MINDLGRFGDADRAGDAIASEPLDASQPKALIPSAEPLNLSGYYISFEPTGVFEIDLILSAVARAGKAYHHTEDWGDETPLYDPRFRGTCPLDWIQSAADDAASAIEARRGETGTGSTEGESAAPSGETSNG